MTTSRPPALCGGTRPHRPSLTAQLGATAPLRIGLHRIATSVKRYGASCSAASAMRLMAASRRSHSAASEAIHRAVASSAAGRTE